MEKMIDWLITLGGTQQHVSLALTGSLLRELVKRDILTLDDAKVLIEQNRQQFKTYGQDIEDQRLREQVRLSIDDAFDRTLENLLATRIDSTSQN